jgi:hypothetical protein
VADNLLFAIISLTTFGFFSIEEFWFAVRSQISSQAVFFSRSAD